ncbi:MAG: hypothetical protein ACYC5M_08015 [Anaerolineae bacterium]
MDRQALARQLEDLIRTLIPAAGGEVPDTLSAQTASWVDSLVEVVKQEIVTDPRFVEELQRAEQARFGRLR